MNKKIKIGIVSGISIIILIIFSLNPEDLLYIFYLVPVLLGSMLIWNAYVLGLVMYRYKNDSSQFLDTLYDLLWIVPLSVIIIISFINILTQNSSQSGLPQGSIFFILLNAFPFLWGFIYSLVYITHYTCKHFQKNIFRNIARYLMILLIIIYAIYAIFMKMLTSSGGNLDALLDNIFSNYLTRGKECVVLGSDDKNVSWVNYKDPQNIYSLKIPNGWTANIDYQIKDNDARISTGSDDIGNFYKTQKIKLNQGRQRICGVHLGEYYMGENSIYITTYNFNNMKSQDVIASQWDPSFNIKLYHESFSFGDGFKVVPSNCKILEDLKLFNFHDEIPSSVETVKGQTNICRPSAWYVSKENTLILIAKQAGDDMDVDWIVDNISKSAIIY